MAPLRPLVIALLAVALAGGLVGCGKKGRPQAPADSTYPRQYPDPETVE